MVTYKFRIGFDVTFKNMDDVNKYLREQRPIEVFEQWASMRSVDRYFTDFSSLMDVTMEVDSVRHPCGIVVEISFKNPQDDVKAKDGIKDFEYYLCSGAKPFMPKFIENTVFDIEPATVSDVIAVNESKALTDLVLKTGIKPIKESKLYTFDDLPDWAKPVVKKDFTEFQKYMDMYTTPDFVELTYKEGGDYMTFRVYKNGTVTER